MTEQLFKAGRGERSCPGQVEGKLGVEEGKKHGVKGVQSGFETLLWDFTGIGTG